MYTIHVISMVIKIMQVFDFDCTYTRFSRTSILYYRTFKLGMCEFQSLNFDIFVDLFICLFNFSPRTILAIFRTFESSYQSPLLHADKQVCKLWFVVVAVFFPVKFYQFSYDCVTFFLDIVVAVVVVAIVVQLNFIDGLLLLCG